MELPCRIQRVDKLSTRCQAFEKTVIFFRFEPVGVLGTVGLETEKSDKQQVIFDVSPAVIIMCRLLVFLFAFILFVAVARLFRQSEENCAAYAAQFSIDLRLFGFGFNPFFGYDNRIVHFVVI